MSEHLPLDVLADLLAGEGDASAVDHVAGCARCSAALADLDAALVPVAAELAALAASPLPAPPADLEQVLLARLHEVSVEDEVRAAPVLAAASDVVPAPVVPLRPRSGGRPRGAGLLGVAAGAVGLLALVGLGIGALGGGGSSDSGSSTAAESAGGGTAALAAPADIPTSSTGSDYGPDSAGFARLLPALLGAGTSVAGTASGTSVPGAAADGGTALDSASRSAATSAPPPAGEASGDESAAGSATSGAAAAAPAPDPLARLRDPAELAGCLSALSGPDTDGVPLALDYAAFQGRPALVVVLPAARPSQVDVFTVGAGCRAGDDQTLFFTRLPRP